MSAVHTPNLEGHGPRGRALLLPSSAMASEEQPCDDCGAQVVDYDKHKAWHDRLEQRMREHDKAATQLRNAGMMR